MSHTPKICSISGPLFHLLLIAINGVKQLFDKLNDHPVKYQFEGCFSNVLKLSFKGRVCGTKGQLLDLLEEAVKSTNTSKELNEYQVFLYRLLRKDIKNSYFRLQKRKTSRRQKRQSCWKALKSSIKGSIRLISCHYLIVTRENLVTLKMILYH